MQKGKTSDKSFLIIIITAAVVVFISAAVCISMVFIPSFMRKDVPVNYIENEYSKTGEYIKYITPEEDSYYDGGSKIMLTACCYKNSMVWANINGNKVLMETAAQSLGDYAVFSCEYQLPSGKEQVQRLGKVSVEATYNGITKIAYGGDIIIKSEAENQTSQTTLPQNIGISQVVEVTGNSADVRELIGSELFYNPNKSLLVKGTKDYVTDKFTYTEDGETKTMLKLLSGNIVNSSDPNITIYNSSEELRYNTVKLSSLSADNGVKVVITNSWQVPFSIKFNNQSYKKGYSSLKYNVDNFTADAIDFVFSYSVAYEGSFTSFSDGIISSFEWLKNDADKTVTLRCHFKQRGRFLGYSAFYDESGNLNISFTQPKKTLSGLKILIDPGHGKTPGAVSRNNVYYESNQTLSISRFLASYLVSNGASVYMTRTADAEVSLETRRYMTEQIKPDLFISVHLNSSPNSETSGTSVFYYTPFSKPLAEKINKRLITAFKTSCYQNNPEMYNKVDQGDNYYPFYVTRSPLCPAVLVEVGYISNELECAYLVDSGYQQLFGQSIYQGIEDYLLSL